MNRFPQSTIKRAREHLLYVLWTQRELVYVRSESGQYETLVSATGIDSAWHWPESLIHQAAEQLQRAGLVTTTLVPEKLCSNGPLCLISLTAKGMKSLCSDKSLRGQCGFEELAAPLPAAGGADAAETPSPSLAARLQTL